MMETYYAGVYWAGRKDPAGECARRAETFFRLLSRCDSIYTRWFEKADSRKKALQLQFEPTTETFVRFFKRRTYQEGRDGFMFGTWTGHEEGHGGMVTFCCGSAAEFVPNNCLLYLPDEEPEVGRVLTTPVLAEVLRAMVLAWEPDWGVVTSDDFRDVLKPSGDQRAFVGWMTYIARSRGEVPPLPEPVRVEPVEDNGSLILLTRVRLTASNPEHVALGLQVQELLLAQRLLNPAVSRPPSS
ncbi:MAG: immunity 52 family protein [Archangium sp.]